MTELMLSAFVTLLVVIDPISLTPIFVALTDGMTAAQRKIVAFRAILIAALTLTLFGLIGDRILATLGIGFPAFRISGGVLLFITAFEMLFAKRRARKEESVHPDEAAPINDPSVFPIAIPLISGPGAIAAIILLMGEHSASFAQQGAILLVMLATLSVTLICFFLAGHIARLLGSTAIDVFTRLLGLLLAALAIQFILDGIRDFTQAL